ncbi:MAG: hypothetical protein U9R34_02120 [Nanoarchaeota archaeon]|nr:hypothetical protein [Nanoarchaeota archaeon]
MPTTTEITEEYIRKHPSIQDCLKKGIINYSSLARRIAEDTEITKKSSIEAILIAARRYAVKIKNEKINEDAIIRLLKNAELDVKTRSVVVVIDKDIYPDSLIDLEKDAKKNRDFIHIIEGVKTITILTTERYLNKIKQKFSRSIIKEYSNLATLIIKTSHDIEAISGVMSYLYSLLGNRGINIIETMSCWTDTILVIDEKDVPSAMEVFRF